MPRGAIQKCGTLRGYKFENYGFDKNVLIRKFACESRVDANAVRAGKCSRCTRCSGYAILTADNKRFCGLLLQPQSFFKDDGVNIWFFRQEVKNSALENILLPGKLIAMPTFSIIWRAFGAFMVSYLFILNIWPPT